VTVALSAFLLDIRPHVSGCSDPHAERAVLLAANEMSRDGLVTQSTLATITVVASTATYALTAPANTEIVEVVAAKFDGEDIAPLNNFDTDQSRNGGSYDDVTEGPVTHYLQDTTASIKLQPIPIAGGSLVVRVATAPLLTVEVLDDAFAGRHRDALIWGTLARLLGTAGKPYTDMATASYYQKKFDSYVARERNIATLGFARGPLRVAACP
jgi:hypothetical protein